MIPDNEDPLPEEPADEPPSYNDEPFPDEPFHCNVSLYWAPLYALNLKWNLDLLNEFPFLPDWAFSTLNSLAGIKWTEEPSYLEKMLKLTTDLCVTHRIYIYRNIYISILI